MDKDIVECKKDEQRGEIRIEILKKKKMYVPWQPSKGNSVVTRPEEMKRARDRLVTPRLRIFFQDARDTPKMWPIATVAYAMRQIHRTARFVSGMPLGAKFRVLNSLLFCETKFL